jgi:aminoglycoside phosphotransferase (APT) family kinase protein
VVDDETVRRLVAAQLPQWSGLPVRRLPPVGTDNQLFRLGDDLLVRMPRIPGPAATVAMGEPGEGFPWPWTVVPWMDGTTPTESSYDPEEWAVELGAYRDSAPETSRGSVETVRRLIGSLDA